MTVKDNFGCFVELIRISISLWLLMFLRNSPYFVPCLFPVISIYRTSGYKYITLVDHIIDFDRMHNLTFNCHR